VNVYIHARTEEALKGLKEHYKESNSKRNKLKAERFGFYQELDVNKKLLTISWKGLISKFASRLSFEHVKERFKEDITNDIAALMTKQGAKKEDYEVVFQDERN